MAYDPKNLSALAYANGFTLWHYRTNDVAADVDTVGYFNKAASFMRIGDFIITNANASGPIENGFLIVRTNTGTSVDVTNLNALGLSNTD